MGFPKTIRDSTSLRRNSHRHTAASSSMFPFLLRRLCYIWFPRILKRTGTGWGCSSLIELLPSRRSSILSVEKSWIGMSPSFISVVVIKYSDKKKKNNSIEEERFIWLTIPAPSPSLCGNTGRKFEHLVTSHAQPRAEKNKCTLACSLVFFPGCMFPLLQSLGPLA